ncbi:hypothetical protein CS022_13095 [Veronia nyctiphanis]|uniref:Uncharacterized protein n=2 Tax=Veronia nyctiphanis TaxID=1278244 RepID=A0A4Q0YP59_9GAMM|nr:hypothetical protein CS022_13095 [Veronia nyctiphanis]
MDQSWHDVVDVSVVESPLNEAVFYDAVMNALQVPVLKEASINNDHFIQLALLDERKRLAVLSYISAIFSGGRLSGTLNEAQCCWSRYVGNISPNICNNTALLNYIDENILRRGGALYLNVSLMVIRRWSENIEGYWPRVKLLMNREIDVPEIALDIPHDTLDYIMACVMTMIEEKSEPAVKTCEEYSADNHTNDTVSSNT